jgi:predicted AlkP superfamily phosphohydrolase/phosphomutase
VDDILYVLEKKEAAALYLIDRYDVDFSLYVFMEIDHLHHKLWRLLEEGSEKGRRLFQEVYQKMDETVGRIVNRFDEETTFILASDHGAGPLEGIMFINKWLMEQGWLKLKKRPSFYLKSFLSRTDLFVKGYRLLCKFGLGRLGKLLPVSLQYDPPPSFPLAILIGNRRRLTPLEITVRYLSTLKGENLRESSPQVKNMESF